MIRKIRTPRIVDDGHGWAGDATAVRRKPLPRRCGSQKGWMDEYCGRSEFELAPMDVITSVPMSDSEPLHRYELDGGTSVVRESRMGSFKMGFRGIM